MNAVEALDEIARIVTTTPRKRSPLEAPAALTNAYVELYLAYGYARAGRSDRARELAASALLVLPTTRDLVHRYLTAALIARLDQAIAGAPVGTPLSEAMNAQLLGLDRVERYKVDRLRGQSVILEPLERTDPIGTWVVDSGSEADSLRRVAIAGRADAAADMLEVAASDVDRRDALLHRVLSSLPTLGHPSLGALLRRAAALVATVGVHGRPLFYARVIRVAELGELPTLISECADSLRATIEHADGEALELALPCLCHDRYRRELAEVLMARPSSTDTRAAIALAGGHASLGDLAIAEPLFGRGRDDLNGHLTVVRRLELSRALALAYPQLPATRARTAIATLATGIRDVTDSYGTNSHFTISVLGFVESLVLGVVGTIAPVERGHDRRGDEYSARGG